MLLEPSCGVDLVDLRLWCICFSLLVLKCNLVDLKSLPAHSKMSLMSKPCPKRFLVVPSALHVKLPTAPG